MSCSSRAVSANALCCSVRTGIDLDIFLLLLECIFTQMARLFHKTYICSVSVNVCLNIKQNNNKKNAIVDTHQAHANTQLYVHNDRVRHYTLCQFIIPSLRSYLLIDSVWTCVQLSVLYCGYSRINITPSLAMTWLSMTWPNGYSW